MPELETLRTRMYRLVTFLILIALLMGALALSSTLVAFRAVGAEKNTHTRQFVRITELERRIVELENRGLPPK